MIKQEGGLCFSKSRKSDKHLNPLISIITVVFNDNKHIQRTISSIASQVYKNIEYIIIDGGSTDGTLETIKKNENFIDYWLSEPDAGIYDAMNKGAHKANGSYLSFLNSSDIYFKDSIENIASKIIEYRFDYSIAPVIIKTASEKISMIKYPPLNFTYEYGKFMTMPAPHLSVFLSKDMWIKLGGYDLAFDLSSDYDLLLRMSSITKNVCSLSDPIGEFYLGGISGSFRTDFDNFYVLKKHGLPMIDNLRILSLQLIKSFVRNILPIKIINIMRGRS